MVNPNTISLRRLAITGLVVVSSLATGVNGLALKSNELEAHSLQKRNVTSLSYENVELLKNTKDITLKSKGPKKHKGPELPTKPLLPIPEYPESIQVCEGWPETTKKQKDAKDHANMEAFCHSLQAYTPLTRGAQSNYTAYTNLMQGGFPDNPFRDTRLSVTLMPFPMSDPLSLWGQLKSYMFGYNNVKNPFSTTEVKQVILNEFTTNCHTTGKETNVDTCMKMLDHLWTIHVHRETNPTSYKAIANRCTLWEWEAVFPQ